MHPSYVYKSSNVWPKLCAQLKSVCAKVCFSKQN